MNTVVVYVLHSPYSDGAWRGWEKCAGNGQAVLVFDSREAAEAYARESAHRDKFRVVPVVLHTPLVRASLAGFGAEGELPARLRALARHVEASCHEIGNLCLPLQRTEAADLVHAAGAMMRAAHDVLTWAVSSLRAPT